MVLASNGKLLVWSRLLSWGLLPAMGKCNFCLTTGQVTKRYAIIYTSVLKISDFFISPSASTSMGTSLISLILFRWPTCTFFVQNRSISGIPSRWSLKPGILQMKWHSRVVCGEVGQKPTTTAEVEATGLRILQAGAMAFSSMGRKTIFWM